MRGPTPIAIGPVDSARKLEAEGKPFYAVSVDGFVFHGFHRQPLEALFVQIAWGLERGVLDEETEHLYVGRVVPFDVERHAAAHGADAARHLVNSATCGLPRVLAGDVWFEFDDLRPLVEKLARAFAEWAREARRVPAFFGVAEVERYAIRPDVNATNGWVATKEAA